MASLLNLTDAEDFAPLPPGAYQCEVFSVEMAETKGGEDAKLPGGTPMMKIQFKVLANRDGETEIDDEGKTAKLENRRFFGQWVIPPKEIDGAPYKHYGMMLGQIARLFKALGYEETVIKDKKGFDPDLDEQVGKQVLVTVGRDMQYGTNPVKGVKALEGDMATALL